MSLKYTQQYLLVVQSCQCEMRSTKRVESYQGLRNHDETGLQAWKVNFLDCQGNHLNMQQHQHSEITVTFPQHKTVCIYHGKAEY